MTDEQKPGKIFAAIVAIMRACDAIAKDAKNKDQGWYYRSIEAVYNVVGKLMRDHGVFSQPVVIEERHETGTSKRGEPLHRCFLKVQYTFSAEDGSSVVVVVAAEAMDSSDKSTCKAMSLAHRMAMTQLLVIPFEVHDPDEESPQMEIGITLAAFNELKRRWLSKQGDVKAKSKAQLSVAFGCWAAETAGIDIRDIADWKQWKQADLDACAKALTEEQTA